MALPQQRLTRSSCFVSGFFVPSGAIDVPQTGLAYWLSSDTSLGHCCDHVYFSGVSRQHCRSVACPLRLQTPQVGPVADGLVKRGVALTTVRKMAQGLAFVVPAACMLACAALTPTGGAAAANVPLLVGLLSVGFAFGAWSRAGLYCNHQVSLILHVLLISLEVT